MPSSSVPGGSSVGASSGGAQPGVVSIAPDTVHIGCGPYTITVDGAGFLVSDIVQVDGVDVPTIFVSSSRLQGGVSDTAITSEGAHNVTVLRSGTASASFPLTAWGTPAQSVLNLPAAYNLGTESVDVLLFNPCLRDSNVTVDFHNGGSPQSVRVRAQRTAAVRAPASLDNALVTVTAPEAPVAGVLLSSTFDTVHRETYLAPPLVPAWASPAASTPLVQGNATNRLIAYNPGGTQAQATVRWLGASGNMRTQDLSVAPGAWQTASNALSDTVQWAEVTSDNPVHSVFSRGRSGSGRWDVGRVRQPATTGMFVLYSGTGPSLRARVANPGTNTAQVSLGLLGGAILASSSVGGRTVVELDLPVADSVTAVVSMTSDQPVTTQLVFSKGQSGENCVLDTMVAGKSLLMMGGRDSDDWETAYVLFNPGLSPAVYTVEVFGAGLPGSFPGGTIPPLGVAMFSTWSGSFPGYNDLELTVQVHATQPLMGQVIRTASSAMGCVEALAR